jgi:hypothetical protein
MGLQADGSIKIYTPEEWKRLEAALRIGSFAPDEWEQAKAVMRFKWQGGHDDAMAGLPMPERAIYEYFEGYDAGKAKLSANSALSKKSLLSVWVALCNLRQCKRRGIAAGRRIFLRPRSPATWRSGTIHQDFRALLCQWDVVKLYARLRGGADAGEICRRLHSLEPHERVNLRAQAAQQ